MALPNYVKFQRGSLASYNRLTVKDNDTLYFIYDAEDENRGTLYLGNRLIGNVGGESGITHLSDLSDVIVSAAQTGDFLVLNSEGKWTATSASNVAQTILESGGNFVQVDAAEFLLNSVNGQLELKGYAQAQTGMIPVKSASGLIWQASPSNLETRVGDLESAIGQVQTDISDIQTELSGVDGKIASAISNVNHLRYEVITNLRDATESNVIYLYSNNSSDPSNQYNEYMVLNGNLELIGAVGIDLSNYMTADEIEQALNAKADASALSALNTRVSTLETNLNDIPATVQGLSSSVSNLETVVSTLDSKFDDYVLTSTFNSVVGDLSTVNGIKNNLTSDATIADNLIEIYDRLTWQEIGE